MDKDRQVVQEADLALIAATEQFIELSPGEQVAVKPQLRQVQGHWAAARYRLLFPDSIAVQQDIVEAQSIRARIEVASGRQQLTQGLIDLGGLLIKFA